jgi:hypothetical protein
MARLATVPACRCREHVRHRHALFRFSDVLAAGLCLHVVMTAQVRAGPGSPKLVARPDASEPVARRCAPRTLGGVEAGKRTCGGVLVCAALGAAGSSGHGTGGTDDAAEAAVAEVRAGPGIPRSRNRTRCALAAAAVDPG